MYQSAIWILCPRDEFCESDRRATSVTSPRRSNVRVDKYCVVLYLFDGKFNVNKEKRIYKNIIKFHFFHNPFLNFFISNLQNVNKMKNK